MTLSSNLKLFSQLTTRGVKRPGTPMGMGGQNGAHIFVHIRPNGLMQSPFQAWEPKWLDQAQTFGIMAQ